MKFTPHQREHGNMKGVGQHRYRGETLCDECREAARRDAKMRWDGGHRQRRAAANRARTRLTDLYPVEYTALFQEELAVEMEKARAGS